MLCLAVKLRLGIDKLKRVGSTIIGGEGIRLYIITGLRIILKIKYVKKGMKLNNQD